MQTDFDIAIVGGGLAGSALAAHLGKSGARIALIEKEVFPRRKPCGEGLAEEGWDGIMAILGSDCRVPATELFGYTVYADSRRVDFAGGAKAVRGVERHLVDTALQRAAFALSNVEPIVGPKVYEVEQSRDHVKLRVSDSALTARFVALADGANSVLAARLKIPCRISSPARYGASVIAKATRRFTTVQILLARGFEVYVTPLSDQRANVSLLGNRASIRRLTCAPELQKTLTDLGEALQCAFDVVAEPIGIGPIGPLQRQPIFGRVLTVGDCCESLDPVSGLGMSHAVLSAECAANALVEMLQERVGGARDYARDHEALVRPFRGYTRLVSLLLSKIASPQLLAVVARAGISPCLRAAVSPSPRGSSCARAFLELAGVGSLSTRSLKM